MRGLIDSIKKSLVLCLVCTLSVSRVDFTSFATDKSDNKPVASQSIKIATSFYDVDHIYNADKHYGAIFSKYASVPVDFNSITDYSDYSKSNIEKVTLHDNTASLDRDLEEKSEWNFKENKFVPYFPVDAYPSLGYYRISIDSLCKSLFDDYCKSNTVDGDSKSDVKKAFDSFLLDDFQLSIKFKDGFSLSCDVNFKSYPYKEKNEGYLTSIDDLIDDASDYSYQGDTGTTDIISVPTSKTIKNKDFYNTDDNAIFDVEEGKDYNTYYVDLDSNNKVKLPLDDISKETVVTDVKLGDDTVYSSPQSLVLNSDNSTSNNTVYIVTGSSMFYGSHLNNLDSIFNRAIDELKGKGITRLTYKGKNYDLNSSDLSFDGVNSGDFLMNAKVPSVVSYSGVNGYECKKGWSYNTYFKPTDLHDILSNNSSVDFDAIIQFKKAPEVSKFNKMKSIDFSDVKPSASWHDTCVIFKYTTDLSLKSDSDGYDNKYYEPWSFFDDVNKPNYNLLRFYADSNYKLPDDYVSKYKRSAVFGMIPDLSKLTSIKSKNRDINVFRVPVDSKDMDKFLDYLDSNIYDGEKILDFIGYNNKVDYMYGRARWSKDHMFGNIDGYYYFPYSSDTVNNWGGDSYIISKDDVIKMLNTCFSDCDFKSDEDFYNSDYFAGASYNFDVSNISQDKIDKWWSDFGSNGKTKCRYDKSNKVLSVPCYYIYYFMLQESGVFYDDLKDYSTLPVYCYTLDTNLGSTVKYNDVPSVKDLMLKRSLNYDIISTFCSFRASNSSMRDSGFKVSNINSLDSYIKSDLDKESTYVTELKFSNRFGKEYDNLDSSYWNFLDKIDEVVSECTRLGFDIDYDLSVVPDTKNLKYNPISDFLDLNITKSNSTLLVDSDSNTSDGCFANPVKSASSGKALSNDSGVANNILTLDLSSINKTDTNSAASSSAIRVYDKRPIYVQVKSEIMSNQVKNAKSADYAWIHDSIDFSKPIKDYTDVASSNVASFISTYVNYKFGNIIFASRPSVVQDLAIDSKGNVIWDKSVDEGLGVDADGKSKSDDIVKLESYTLYVSDKDGNKLYTDTVTPSEAHDSALKTPVVSPSSIVVTQSAVKAKAFRKMSTVTPVSDALFTIPDEYNVAGNIITVYATNVLGDSDEVSITIPAKATPTPVPTATPTKRPSNPNPPVVVITNTPEVTATPTVEPTSTPVPEYKLTVEDVYYDEDGTKEKSDERLTITVKEGEHYSYPSLDKDNYIARVSKFEGTVTSDVKLVFEYDKKKSKDLIVQGYVKKSDGTPVDNSLVEIVDEESKSDVTDNTGFYRIEGVSEGEHDYILYSGATTGSSIVAKCKISVKDNNGEVKVTFKSEDSKIDTQTEEGVVRIDATLFDEEVTQSPAPTEVPTPEPTVEPTVIPTVVPTPIVATRPAVTASPEISPKPTVVPPSDMPTPLEPDEVETPKPTKKPIKSTHKVVGIPIFTPKPDNEVKEERVTLVQTGLYDNTKSVVGLILTTLGVCILFISLKKRNKK